MQYFVLQLGMAMAIGTTTSIRLSPEIRQKLEWAAQSTHRGKNWIIAQALKEYFIRHGQAELAKEAKRQSMLASQPSQEDEEIWEKNSDTEGWE